MIPLKNFTLQEISMLEAELFIARLRKWMVCLGVAAGSLFMQFDSLSAAQGLFAAAAIYYSLQIEGYYRSVGVKGLKYLSAMLDLALLWGMLALWIGLEYHYLGLFYVNAVLLVMRFAVSGWPWLLLNIILFVIALYCVGSFSVPPLEAVWLLLVSALGAWLAQEHRQMDSRFLALYRLGHLFSSTLRENQIFSIAVRELVASWPGSNCHVAKLNSSGEFIVVASSKQDFHGKLDLGTVINAKLMEEMEPVAIKNTLQDKRLTSDFLKRFYLKSVLLSPVVAQGRTIALVLIELNNIREFNHDELAIVMLASGQVGISLENARLYERMEKLARFDELTNIYNRRAFHEVVEAELGQSKQQNSRLSLVMVDIDYFKKINDRWGHQAGDHVLARLADLMKQNLRAGDSVSRFGGEEFVIILPGADCRTAVQVAERVRRAVEGADWQEGLKVTVSAGVASYPDDGENINELLQNADRALYEAKSGGRNQVRHACGLGPEGKVTAC